MNKRPKQTDTEDDVLQMQESFLAEKAKNPNFRPSAQVVRKDRGKLTYNKHLHKCLPVSFEIREKAVSIFEKP